MRAGGKSGIRTHGTIASTHAFQACSLNHSDILPGVIIPQKHGYVNKQQKVARLNDIACPINGPRLSSLFGRDISVPSLMAEPAKASFLMNVTCELFFFSLNSLILDNLRGQFKVEG